MKKLLITILLLSFLVVTPVKAASQLSPETISLIQTLIQLLLQKVALLQAQLVELQAQEASRGYIATSPIVESMPQLEQQSQQIIQEQTMPPINERDELKRERSQKVAILNEVTPYQITSCQKDRRQQLKDAGYFLAFGLGGNEVDQLTEEKIESLLTERSSPIQSIYLQCINPSETKYKTQAQQGAYQRIKAIDKRLNEIE